MAGGVGMYIHNYFNYTVIERTCDEAFQALWVSIRIAKKFSVICGVIYRQHNSPEKFLSFFEQTVEKLSAFHNDGCQHKPSLLRMIY